MAKTETKTRVTKKQVIAHRTKATRDTSPKWDGCETWTGDAFMAYFRRAMDYYRLEADGKSFKPAVIRWYEQDGADAVNLAILKKAKDFRFNSTVGGIASCLTRGMTAQRDDFNGGKDSSEWLRKSINDIIEAARYDIDPAELAVVKEDTYTPSIQDRMRDTAARMTEELEDALENFHTDPDNFDPKAFKVLNLLKGKGAKAAHARLIKGFYARDLAELEELASGNADEQLREGYKHRSKKQIRSLIAFYQEIASACDMLAQEAKVNKKPRARKAVPAEKIVAKLKYKKSDEPLKLVSVNPTAILGSKELWIYNTKSRKLGRYVAAEYQELGVKGSSITGFDADKSVMKTLRKPEEKLKEFKTAGKIQLRRFLEDINAVEAKMNGRINEEILLLKAS